MDLTNGATAFAAVMPKDEIQATQFLKDYPECDGRGVTVAVFDTGVDPGAVGLQVTSEGKPKVIDMFDCSGSGDVDTSKVVKADDDGTITSLNGRKMLLNPEWVNPSGDWHVGMKRVFDLLPGSVVQRLKQKRKEQHSKIQALNVTQATQELNKFKKENGSDSNKLNEEQKKQLAELEARLKLLSELDSKATDLGPMIHCIVWNTGEDWRAALDSVELYPEDNESKKGELKDFVPLTDYRKEFKYGTFSDLDYCNFGINIYDNGNILEIIVDINSHGTHVAGIIAACHPDNPALNGIAPGAQIISCKIGDTRVEGMETGTGVTRALIAAINRKVDLINMSYGEATTTPNKGRFIELSEEAVYRQGIIFVSSAGNNGPALSTVGAPGGTSSCTFSIGAYLSPQMAQMAHSHIKDLQDGLQYTWSSRGPTPDGHQGVMISAPGGAIAPVPQWSTSKRRLMNGTSMSSPNACGGIALLLSYLKQNNLQYSDARVRRALQNSALALSTTENDSNLTHGYGLLQVSEAIKLLQKGYEQDEMDVRYDVNVQRVASNNNSNGFRDRGIYVRDLPIGGNGSKILKYRCEVKPKVHEDAEVDSMLAIEHQLVLKVVYGDGSQGSWVQAPAAVMLHHGGRSIDVTIDLSQLADDKLYYAQIVGYDATDDSLGALFRIPVTVIMPHIVPQGECCFELGHLSFTPGEIVRRFVQVPESATWAELQMGPVQVQGSSSTFFSDVSQLLPQTRYSDSQSSKVISVSNGDHHYQTFPVHPGSTLEITLAQYWTTIDPAQADVKIDFHSVKSSCQQGLHLDGASSVTPISVWTPLRSEKVNPQAKLTHVCIPVRPFETKLVPLETERDTLPRNRVIHQLILSYKFSLAEAGKVTPKCVFNRQVYDNVVEAQFYMIFDSNQSLVGDGDLYPKTHELPKGDYTLKLMLRHDNVDLLEKFKTTSVVLHKAVEKDISVPVYSNLSAALQSTSNSVFKERVLSQGDKLKLFVGPVPEDNLPKDAKPKTLMIGTLNLGKCSTAVGGGCSPCKTELHWTVPPAKESGNDKNNNNNKKNGEEKDAQTKFEQAVRDAKVKFIKDLERKDESEEWQEYFKMYEDVKKQYPDHLPLLKEHLKKIEAKYEKQSEELVLVKTEDVLQAVEDVLRVVDDDKQTELAKFVAEKCPSEEADAEKRKKEMEEVKEALVAALAAKTRIHIKKETPDEEQLNACFKELRKWVDTTDDPHQLLHAKREMKAGRYAQAIGVLNKIIDNTDKSAPKSVWELKAECYEKLGWGNWQKYQQNLILNKFPVVQPLF